MILSLKCKHMNITIDNISYLNNEFILVFCVLPVFHSTACLSLVLLADRLRASRLRLRGPTAALLTCLCRFCSAAVRSCVLRSWKPTRRARSSSSLAPPAAQTAPSPARTRPRSALFRRESNQQVPAK